MIVAYDKNDQPLQLGDCVEQLGWSKSSRLIIRILGQRVSGLLVVHRMPQGSDAFGDYPPGVFKHYTLKMTCETCPHLLTCSLLGQTKEPV